MAEPAVANAEDALTHPAPARETKRAEAKVEEPIPTAPQESAPAIARDDFDSAPPIASPFHSPAAVQPSPPITVTPSEHVFAPVEIKPETQPPLRPVATPRPIPELPPVSLTLPPDSGLELVETKFKAAAITEPEPPAGPRRVRPPKVTVVEEPLQIVETQRTQLPPGS